MAVGRPVSQAELDAVLGDLECAPDASALAAGSGAGDREYHTGAGWMRVIAGLRCDRTYTEQLARVAVDVARDHGLVTDGTGVTCEAYATAWGRRWPGWLWRLAYARVGSPREWEQDRPEIAARRAEIRRTRVPRPGRATVPTPEDVMRRYLERREVEG